MTEIFQNIRKTYNFAAPDEALSNYVEFYGETCPDKTRQYLAGQHYTIRMFPSWTPTFYINLGKPYQMSVGAAMYELQVGSDVLIFRNNITERFNLPDDHIFIVKFMPGGLEAVLDINPLSIPVDVCDLRRIIPPVFIDKLKKLSCFEERARAMNRWLLDNFREKKKEDHYLKIVQAAIGEYTAAGMTLSTSALAEKTFTSSKTMNRYFHRKVGVSPKTFFSAIRARAALSAYVNQPADFDPVDFGYYDRSHFYKNMLRFTGEKLNRF